MDILTILVIIKGSVHLSEGYCMCSLRILSLSEWRGEEEACFGVLAGNGW